jgi:hypothetical protein
MMRAMGNPSYRIRSLPVPLCHVKGNHIKKKRAKADGKEKGGEDNKEERNEKEKMDKRDKRI